jgi:GH15 family glucan-1,4-alpha-glucosidase
VLLRRIEVQRGRATVNIALQPPRPSRSSKPGRWSGRGDERVWRPPDAKSTWQLTGINGAHVANGALQTAVRLREGEHHDVVLVISDGDDTSEPVDADMAWATTAQAWEEAVPPGHGLGAARDVRQSFAVLFGLTAPSGGTVAAATSGLPERTRGHGYDYRYVWIRDACYAGAAAAAADAPPFVERAVKFVSERLAADREQLKPAYTIDGDPVPPEHELGLPGYPGGTDVIGNQVRRQFQLDPFGEALRLFAVADELGVLDARGWSAARIAANAIEQRWHEPDAGIWELDPRHWTHGRLICAAGLRAMAARPDARDERASWLALADRITASASEYATHTDGRWQRAPDDERVDAALLLAGIRGAVAVDDPRHVATYEAVREQLCHEGYVYRFRNDGTPLGEGEGAFVLCSFWMSLAALGQGDTTGATFWFERARAACGQAGLFAEEFDVTERQQRGNLPQAFVHALLVETAVALQRAHESS